MRRSQNGPVGRVRRRAGQLREHCHQDGRARHDLSCAPARLRAGRSGRHGGQRIHKWCASGPVCKARADGSPDERARAWHGARGSKGDLRVAWQFNGPSQGLKRHLHRPEAPPCAKLNSRSALVPPLLPGGADRDRATWCACAAASPHAEIRTKRQRQHGLRHGAVVHHAGRQSGYARPRGRSSWTSQVRLRFSSRHQAQPASAGQAATA